MTPSLERATQIPVRGPRKAALDLALRFEEAILARTCADGVFGPERTLVESYQVSPKVVRQALRILESRFLGTMQRGVRGGLVLRRPVVSDSAELMAIHLCSIATDPQEVRDAMDMLLPEMSDRSDMAKAFVMDLLTALDGSLDEKYLQTGSVRSRALVIARRVVSEQKEHLVSGTARVKLGTLIGLEDEHASGRPIILQAMRILEDMEIIESRLGRSGGMVVRQPSPGAVVRAVYAHFVLRDLTLDTAREIIWSINRANAVRSAAVITPQQAEMLDQFSGLLRLDHCRDGDHSAELTLWRMLGDISGNKVIHMLVRCLFYFRVRSNSNVSTYLAEPTSQSIRKNASDIVRAVSARQPDKARQAIVYGEIISGMEMMAPMH